MRNLKTLGLAVISVLALVAFAGATTASATRLCSTAGTPCAAPYASGTTFNAKLKTGTNAVLTTSGGASNPTLTCTTSTVQLVSSSAGGGAGVNVTGNLTGLTFSGCTSVNPAGCSSSATVTGLPKSGTIAWTSGNNGTLTVNAPTVSFTCTILGFPVNCSFGGSGSVSGTVTGANPAGVKFTNQSIASTGGFGCPTAAVWNAEYVLTAVSGSPTALFVTNS
ncbi:MAG TPA: hypothetical protein VGO71_20400 [Baekduia sp.]|jgi:hypothetical protein|nr:hypothetical protein [Baekduia sp.]